MKAKKIINESKLYTIKLIRRDMFGHPESSKEWFLLKRVIDEDLNKKEIFIFDDPNDSAKKYYRHYVDSPANGNTHLVIGAFEHPMDFSCVWLILESYYYGVPYLAIDKYKLLFPNADILAVILARAFNRALRKYKLEVVLEPLNAKGIIWCLDYKDSYYQELQAIGGVNLIKGGFEDALEEYKLRLQEEEEKRRMAKKKPINEKSDNIEDYIVNGDPVVIVGKLKEVLKGLTNPKDIARPIRLLCDHGVIWDEDEERNRLPYKAFVKAFPEVKAHISESSYNDWLNETKTSYNNDLKYRNIRKIFNFVIF